MKSSLRQTVASDLVLLTKFRNHPIQIPLNGDLNWYVCFKKYIWIPTKYIFLTTSTVKRG